MPEAEGIVVLGISRSGTTLVRRLLDAHPDVAAPAETLVLSAAARFLHRQPLGSGVAYGVLAGLSLAGFPETEVLDRLRTFAFGFLEEHAERHGARIWAEKTATDVFHLPAIESFAGDRVHYVGMIRHGLDVAPSLLELVEQTGGYFEELHAYAAADPRPLVAMARAWADATDAILDLADRRPDRCTLVRYEDLVRDPEPPARPTGLRPRAVEAHRLAVHHVRPIGQRRLRRLEDLVHPCPAHPQHRTPSFPGSGGAVGDGRGRRRHPGARGLRRPRGPGPRPGRPTGRAGPADRGDAAVGTSAFAVARGGSAL